MSRLIIQNDCVFSGEYIEKILQKKTNPPPIVKIEVKNELKNIENFIAKIFKAPPIYFYGSKFQIKSVENFTPILNRF